MHINPKLRSRFILLASVGVCWTATLALAKDEASTCIDCTLPPVSAPIGDKSLTSVQSLAEQLNQNSLKDLTFLDPQLIEKTDSRLMGEMIVSRITQLCDKFRDPSLSKPDDSFSEIIMLVPAKHLASIATYGFKNQHQTSVTGGCNCKTNRLQAEESHVMMGLPYTNKTRELLPKYALQVFNSSSLGQHRVPWDYGDVMVRFKPSVKKRATWVEMDSLGVTDEYDTKLLPLRTNAIRPVKNKRCQGYCEAQIWGDLDFSDVESVIVPEGMEISDTIKSLGVPVHQYKKTEPKYGSYGSYGGSSSYASSPGYTSYAPGKTPEPSGGGAGGMMSTYGATAPAPEQPKPEPPKFSLTGVELGEKPVFTPSTSSTRPNSSSMSLKEVTKAIESATNPVQKSILEGIRLSKMPTEDLIKEYRGYAKPTADKKKEDSWMSYSSNTIGEGSARVLAEITAREKTKEIKSFLAQEFKDDSNSDAIKTMALMGLSELDPKELKPLLLEALMSENKLLRKTAGFMALSLKSDPEMSKALEQRFGKIASRFTAKEFCQKEEFND